MPEGTILLIDDEEFLRQAIARTLELEGYTVLQAPEAYRGLALLREHAEEILVVLSDVKLPDGRGLDLLPRYKALAPLAEVVLMTAYGTIADGVQAMKTGAFDYLTKSDGKGAFTGANIDKKGLFEEANGGTLFLDEVGELESSAQAKLLRALETQEFTKLGDTRPTRVNVRLLAATNRNLRQQAAEHHFRADLYYRLSVVELAVPPLSARLADVPLLVQHFALHFGAKLKQKPLQISVEAMQALSSYAWPGNIRELKNVVERAAILTPPGQPLTVDDLPPEIQLTAPRAGQPGSDDPRTLRNAERLHVQRILLESGGNKAEAARVLGIAHTTLYRKIQEYGL